VDRDLSVRRAVEMTVAEWEDIDRTAPAPTFFARPAWAHAVNDVHPRITPAPMWCEFADGSRVFVPMVRSRGRLGWREYFAMPLDTYTAAFENDGRLAGSARAGAAFAYILRHLGHGCQLTPWPPAYAGIELPGISGKPRETSLLDLSDGTDAALARMDGKARRMAHQAERRGVICTREISTDQAVDEYWAMLCITAAAWERGVPTFPKKLLEAVVVRGGADVEIWFARYEGKPIAGGLVLFGSDELMFWSAAMLSEFGTLRPSNALNVALIRAAGARAVRWYNLGASTGLPGVKRFKEGLGAFGTSYTKFSSASPGFALYCDLRKLLSRVKGRARDSGF